MDVTKEELFKMIIELRERVDALTGKPRGPITMHEYRLACERKDKATMRAYLRQWEANRSFPPGATEGDSRENPENRETWTRQEYRG